MSRQRKTIALRRAEFADAEHRVWASFRSKLDALRTLEDAWSLVAEAPRPDTPGRRYYSNLNFFLEEFRVPMNSTSDEKALYAQFIERLDAAGTLKPGAGQSVLQELTSAIEEDGVR